MNLQIERRALAHHLAGSSPTLRLRPRPRPAVGRNVVTVLRKSDHAVVSDRPVKLLERDVQRALLRGRGSILPVQYVSGW